jgi:hypothetical protein
MFFALQIRSMFGINMQSPAEYVSQTVTGAMHLDIKRPNVRLNSCVESVVLDYQVTCDSIESPFFAEMCHFY